MSYRRRRPDAFDALGALTLLTAAVLAWFAVTDQHAAAVHRLLETSATAVVIAPAPVTVPLPGVGR